MYFIKKIVEYVSYMVRFQIWLGLHMFSYVAPYKKKKLLR